MIAASADNYTESLSQMNVNADVITRDVNNAPPAQDVHLVIAADVLTNQSYTVLKNLAAALKSGCFILLEETTAQLDLKIALKETDLTLTGKQTDSVGKTYLLLKKRKQSGEPIVIQITEKNLSWLEDVKAALKKSDSEDQEVLLVSHGEETLGKIIGRVISNFHSDSLVARGTKCKRVEEMSRLFFFVGLVGLVTCIRREIGGANARYIFIQDKNAPKFGLSVRFYAEQLDKGLMANVLKGNQWGSYRHLPLDQPNNVSSLQVEHAYVNTLTRGDLSSLRWIEGPLSYYRSDNSSNMKLCSVYYAPLNFR